MDAVPDKLTIAKARLPHPHSIIVRLILKGLLIGVPAVVVAMVYWYFGDLLTPAGELKMPEASKIPEFTLVLAHSFFQRLGGLLHHIVSVGVFFVVLVALYIVDSYRMKFLALDEMQLLETELAKIKAEGLRLVPYRSRDNHRYFFHADVWNEGIDPTVTTCDLTVDFIFAGTMFHARNYILSPSYLRYFFSRPTDSWGSKIEKTSFGKIDPEPLNTARAVRIVIIGPIADQNSGHDQDLLVYLNMSALAGYATYVVPREVYERALPIMKRMLAGESISTSKINEFFRGHLTISAKYENEKLYPLSAVYDEAHGMARFKPGVVQTPVSSVLLHVALNHFCLDGARIAKVGKGEAITVEALADKLKGLLRIPNWPYGHEWTVDQVAVTADARPPSF